MVTAIIVAAGRGTRMGPGIDKMFLELAGRPVVQHTWSQFDSCREIDHVVLVIRPDLKADFEKLARSMSPTKPFTFAAGGPERQDSVWNGIEAAPRDTEIVAIQDAARPCTTHQTIADTIAVARQHGAAVAARPATDTIKLSRDGRTISTHLDRTLLWTVQTPQTFRLAVIRQAILDARKRGVSFTDDTAACEAIGQAVHLVAGTGPNPKVTTPDDLPWIELLLARRIQ